MALLPGSPRLAEFEVQLPALRDRAEDVPALLATFLSRPLQLADTDSAPRRPGLRETTRRGPMADLSDLETEIKGIIIEALLLEGLRAPGGSVRRDR